MHYTVPDLRLRCFDQKSFRDGILRDTQFTVHDIIQIPAVYDMETYKSVVAELTVVNDNSNGKLIIPWHKKNHLVVNDKYRNGQWKDECPAINKIIDDIASGFNITVNNTRVNIYRSGESGRWGHSDIKPFHHDDNITQNMTFGVSLGCEREIAFKQTKRKKCPDSKWRNIPSGTIISTVASPGSIYAFARDVNCEFQHGILPVHGSFGNSLPSFDRISIVVWGTSYTMDTRDSRVSHNNIPSSIELGETRIGNKRFTSTN
jgi:hypothetical protein